MLTIGRLASGCSFVTRPLTESGSKWVFDQSFSHGQLVRYLVWSPWTDLHAGVLTSTLGGHFLFLHCAVKLHLLFSPNRSFHRVPT
jgi:hypothetical protein